MERTDTNNSAATGDATVESLKAALRHEHEMYLRALADFENYRKRQERDRDKEADNAKRGILLPLLDILDNFDRALQYISTEPASVAEGVRAIHRRLTNLMQAQNVAPLKTVGEPFDPAVHEAIGSVESGEHPSGTVAEEVQRGYRLGDELLRPARVRVAR